MRASRKAFLTAAAGASATFGTKRYPAGAAEFDFKLSTANPPSLHIVIRLVEAAAKVKQDSNGRLDIRVFPSSQLGNTESEIQQVRAGAIEMCAAIDGALADTVPIAGITATPFLFASGKEAVSVMAGPFGAYVRRQIEKSGVYPFGKSCNLGMRQIVNRLHPIYVPEDLKGMKVRSGAPVETALFNALGASPTPLTTPEVYPALQTHLIDGTLYTLAGLEALKIYEAQQKYCSYLNITWAANTVIVNNDAWQRLPKNLRDLTERSFDDAIVQDYADLTRLETTLEATLRGKGMEFNQANIPAFQSAVRQAGLYAKWRDQYGGDAWTLLEKAVGKR